MQIPPDMPAVLLKYMGRNGDTELAHVNPREKAMLQRAGGAGTINPSTGMREYYDEGGGTAGGSYGGGFADPNDGTNNGGGGGGFPGSEVVGGPGTPGYEGPYGPSQPSFFDNLGGFLANPVGNLSAMGRSYGTELQDNPDRFAGLLSGAAGLAFAPMGMAMRGAQEINDRYFGGLARADVNQNAGGAASGTNPQGAALTSTIPGVATAPPAPIATSYYPGDLNVGRRVFSYAEGGQVGPGGMPQRPGLGAQRPAKAANPQMLMAEAQRFAQQNPQQVQQIKAEVQSEIQSGEMNLQQLTALVNMAMVALQQPDMYPQLRTAAIRQGLAEEDDLSPQFDPGVLFILLLIGQSMGIQGGAQPQAPQPPQAQAVPSMAIGGALPARSPNSDGSIDIKAHEGEYVVPAHVVRAKGTEFFDKLVNGAKRGDQ